MGDLTLLQYEALAGNLTQVKLLLEHGTVTASLRCSPTPRSRLAAECIAETGYRRMKDTYRRRMTKLGLLPDMVPLRLIVSEPRAISRLRGAA